MTRLVLLGLTAFFNWALVFTLALFITGGRVGVAFPISVLVMGGLAWLACSSLGEGYVRTINRLRPPIKAERACLEPVLQTVLRRAGRITTQPELFVSPDDFPGALAIGTRTIAVTEGLLRQEPSDAELEGILAHELAHLLHGDTRIMLAAHVLNTLGRLAVWAITALIGFLAVFAEFTAEVEGVGFLLGFLVALWAWCLRFCAWVFYRLLELSFLAVGRQGEYAADLYAARLGFGAGLVSYLSRDLSGYRQSVPSLMFRLYATHPPAKNRIERVRGVTMPWVAVSEQF